jgi:phage shock protein PspC (stress-responsive transcriptional regulator)
MKRLYRSEDDKVLGGVLGGIAKYLAIDPVVIRFIAIITALVTGIVPFALVYLLAVFMIPKEQSSTKNAEDH